MVLDETWHSVPDRPSDAALELPAVPLPLQVLASSSTPKLLRGTSYVARTFVATEICFTADTPHTLTPDGMTEGVLPDCHACTESYAAARLLLLLLLPPLLPLLEPTGTDRLTARLTLELAVLLLPQELLLLLPVVLLPVVLLLLPDEAACSARCRRCAAPVVIVEVEGNSSSRLLPGNAAACTSCVQELLSTAAPGGRPASDGNALASCTTKGLSHVICCEAAPPDASSPKASTRGMPSTTATNCTDVACGKK